MDVLGDWQHYGRTRNTHFEDMMKKCNEREAEIGHLKRQVRVCEPQSMNSVMPNIACISIHRAFTDEAPGNK